MYSPFEAELLAITWMCEKEDFNLRAAPLFKVFSDAKNMGAFLKSDMQKVKNPRCFKMMERLLPYSFEVEYKEGRKWQSKDTKEIRLSWSKKKSSHHRAKNRNYKKIQKSK